MNKYTCFAICLALFGCADMMFKTPEYVQPILERKLVGLPAQDLFVAYGEPTRSEVQYGHHVYYWESISVSSYTPQYTSTTQGYIGSTPYSGTTTTAGETQVSAVPCVLVAGTRVDSDIVERIQVRGFSCGAFLR